MTHESEKDLIIRDHLARQRTKLSNQRTLLSYIRTALYFLVSGTALFEVQQLDHVRNLGYLAFGLSFVFLVFGFINFYKIKSKLNQGKYFKM